MQGQQLSKYSFVHRALSRKQIEIENYRYFQRNEVSSLMILEDYKLSRFIKRRKQSEDLVFILFLYAKRCNNMLTLR